MTASPKTSAGRQAGRPTAGAEQSRSLLAAEHLARFRDRLGDAAVADILALNATQDDFETAVAWAEQESDVMGKQRRPLTGKAAQIADIIMADDAWREEMESHRS